MAYTAPLVQKPLHYTAMLALGMWRQTDLHNPTQPLRLKLLGADIVAVMARKGHLADREALCPVSP
ncbi:hypothetical protein SAMN05216338_106021 [Bradyrhizobium sp. Rc2d]|uniref:hypothetical protein n=1 Tax=Bradyrhizobium sp. Rc2d TaxID=1855321 RepID=UPI000891A88E|nr:hypothetical protein [Bradyrhizobium sp. Rc2d]SDJ68674.1 hypothetical protein SAMN05216338_106021 [Bradyrhizobium sp. Rc2d]